MFAVEVPDVNVTVERLDPSTALPGPGGSGAFRVVLTDGEDELAFTSEFYIWQAGASWISLEFSGDELSPDTVRAAMDALQQRLDANPAR